TRPAQILSLEKKYGIEVAGIHLPTWWKKSCWRLLSKQPGIFSKLSSLIIHFYLGCADQNPGWQIAEALGAKHPYVIFHTDVVADMGKIFNERADSIHAVIENIPYYQGNADFYWNPAATEKEMRNRGLNAGMAFDPGHFGETVNQMPNLNLLESYKQFRPEIIHISYNSHGLHLLPDEKEQEELQKMVQIYPPKYIVIETMPWVSAKKAKKMMEEIIEEGLKNN
ncbi:hypothetical protein D4R52_03600, partial [bacterium]